MISKVVKQEWVSRGEFLQLLQGGAEVADLVPASGETWIWRARGQTTPGLHGQKFTDLESAQVAVSAHFEACVVPRLSQAAQDALRTAGLLP